MPVAEVVYEIPDCFLRCYFEGIVESLVGGDNLQAGIQHHEWLSHVFYNVLGIKPPRKSVLKKICGRIGIRIMGGFDRYMPAEGCLRFMDLLNEVVGQNSRRQIPFPMLNAVGHLSLEK